MNVIQQITPAQAGSGEPNYLSGFGNGFETEALPGALPVGRNSPQRCAYGLYAEQLSGSPFTAPRATNERSWLYRIRPTVQHWGHFTKTDIGLWRTAPGDETGTSARAARWDPIPIPRRIPLLLAGRAHDHDGGRCRHASRHGRAYLSDHALHAGRILLQRRRRNAVRAAAGRARLWTEFGIIDVEPGEIAVIPRGVKIRVELKDGPARGYLCENYGGALTLPERGPIGANCLANPRDFLTPVAAYEDREAPQQAVREMGRHALGDRDRPLAARRRRLARQLRAVQIRLCAISRRSGRSCSIMPTPASSPC